MPLPFIFVCMSDPGLIDSSANTSAVRRLWRYGPLLLWLGFIFYASTSGFSADNTSRFIRPFLRWLFPSYGEPELDWLHFLVRKAGHFFEYALLAFLARRAFITSSRLSIRRWWFELSLLLVVLYALFDEWHQSFEPTRTGSIFDSLIDIAGGLTVLLIYKGFVRTERGGSGSVADGPRNGTNVY
jgi:VanZ family protein